MILPINHTIAGGTDPTTIQSGGMSTLGATFAVAITTYLAGGTPPVVSDDFGSIWNDLVAYSTLASGATIRISHAMLAGTGPNHKFQAQGTGCYPAIAPLVFSGVRSAQCDEAIGAEVDPGSLLVATMQPGDLTPTEDNELVILGVGWAPTGGIGSVSAPYTLADQIEYTGFIIGTATAYRIQTAATLTNPIWTFGNNVNEAVATLASFRVEPDPRSRYGPVSLQMRAFGAGLF